MGILFGHRGSLETEIQTDLFEYIIQTEVLLMLNSIARVKEGQNVTPRFWHTVVSWLRHAQLTLEAQER